MGEWERGESGTGRGRRVEGEGAEDARDEVRCRGGLQYGEGGAGGL